MCHVLAGLLTIFAASVSEVPFENLRTVARNWLHTADASALERFREAADTLADCPGETYEDESTLIVVRLGTSYRFYSIDRPGGRHCFFMVEPFRRPLSRYEALDLQAALLMPDAPSVSPPVSPQSFRRSEERFAQLLDETRKQGDAQRAAARLELRTFDDCSHVDAEELRARPGDQATRYIYNGAYSWKEVQGPSGVCIFMDLPLSRGLGIDEARLFIRATQIPFPTMPRQGIAEPRDDDLRESHRDRLR